MSLKSKPFWWVECDFPDCGVSAQEGMEYAAWGDPDAAEEAAYESDWWTDPDGERHYCDDHPTVWESDVTDKTVTLPPSPPFLLLLDSDDGRQARLVVAP